MSFSSCDWTLTNFLGGELELDDRDAGGFEVCEESYFGGLEEHKGAAVAVGAACPASDAVNVFAGVVRGVALDDPQSTSGI